MKRDLSKLAILSGIQLNDFDVEGFIFNKWHML